MNGPEEHGPWIVCYYNGPYGFKPSIQCICGWSSCGWNLCWEEVGMDFDNHLAEAAKGTKP